MSRILKYLTVLLIFFPAISCAGIFDIFKSGTSEELQHDLDIVRLNDLATLSGYIEKYKEITGKYPFQGETELPHYVYIATKEQQQYTKGGPPYSHKKTDAKIFVKELISKLGSDIEVPFDLQRVPMNKPNFYIYMVRGNGYYLAVHLHQEFPFTKKVSEYYHKVEVTNYQGNNKGTWLRNNLLADKSYQEAKNALPNKPGYTEDLRLKLGGNMAF